MRKPRNQKRRAIPLSEKTAEGGGQGGGGLDRILFKRIEQYAMNNDIADVEEVCDAIRVRYQEYARQKVPVFRKAVERAIAEVNKKGIDKPEISLQALEEKHLSKRSFEADGEEDEDDSDDSVNEEDSADDEDGDMEERVDVDLADADADVADAADMAGVSTAQSEDDSEDEDSDSSDEEEPQLVATPAPKRLNLLNRAMLAVYKDNSKSPEATHAAERKDVTPSSARSPAGVRLPYSSGTPELKGAFASPEVVAAACARDAAARAAVAAGKSGASSSGGGKEAGDTAPSAPAPSTTPKPAAVTAPRASNGASLEAKLPGKGSAKKRKRSWQRAAVGRGAAEGGAGAGREAGSAGGPALQPSGSKNIRFADLGGIESALEAIRETIMFPLMHPEVYAWLGVEAPRGVLLHGPPGCGKSTLANAIANEAGVPFYSVAAPEVVSGMSGESEAKVRSIFAAAAAAAPAIIFLDEIDAITPKRENAQREMERRIVAQLLTCMDNLSAGPPPEGGAEPQAGAPAGHVIVIGATNRPDAIDPALRRAGRFDREIVLGVPSEDARAHILRALSAKLRLEGAFDFERIAHLTPGYVGADLTALTKEAAAVAIRRIFLSMQAGAPALPPPGPAPSSPTQPAAAGASDPPPPAEPITMELDEASPAERPPASEGEAGTEASGPVAAEGTGAAASSAPAAADPPWLESGPLGEDLLRRFAITMEDFKEAVKRVQPSSIREGFAMVPGVTWADVGALEEVQAEMSFAISQPIANPQRFAAMGLGIATGILLYGPPGCGKTLVAKAVANEARANFISIKGPELLNKYVGESERAVRTVFSRARAAAPCVLFFDEMDALAPRRGGDGGVSAERVVNQLLTELDGLEGRGAVFVVAATNRPDMIDPAMLRPGRLDKLLFIPLPGPEGRASIVATLTRNVPLGPAFDPAALVRSDRAYGYSGADLAALVREACILALREQSGVYTDGDGEEEMAGKGLEPPVVLTCHFEAALKSVLPSVSKEDARKYEELRKKLRRSRGQIGAKAKEAEAEAEGAARAGQGGGADGAAPTPPNDDSKPNATA